MKKTIIIGFILLLTLPFIFIKTLFPFYRFGMFAEPVKTSTQTERLSIRYQQENGLWTSFDGTEIGLSESVFASLMRKHHYQDQEVELLQKTASVYQKAIIVWEMWRFEQQDSTRIGSWQP